MGAFYKPYPDEVYRINELLPDKLKEAENSEAFFIDTFDYTNRCVNYSFVALQKRRFNDLFKAETILNFFNNNSEWSFLCKCLKKYYPNEADQHIKLFENLKAKSTTLDEKEKIEFHYKLVNLYNFFPRRQDMHIDGVLKNIASKLANRSAFKDNSRFKAVYVETLTKANFPSELKGLINNKDDNRWIGMRFINPAGEPIEAEIGLDKNDGDNCYFDQYNPNEPDGKRLDATEYQDRQKFFDKYLWPLFYVSGYPGDKRFEFDKNVPHFFLVVPVFSAPIGGNDYGTILGHLYVTFSKQDSPQKKASNNNALLNLLWDSWAPLAAQAILHGRENDLLAQPIKHGDDILKDFLSKIAHMQDWEKVMVFSNRNEKNDQGKWRMPEYCFKRYRGGKDGGRLPFEEVWDICQPSPEKSTECSSCVDALNGHTNGQSRGFAVRGKYYFRFDLKNVLDEKVLPAMDAKDEAENSHRVLFFQFPSGTFFPSGSSDKGDAIAKLGEHYRNRMLPVFDKLLLKRKVLQHSTKSAVSAIISRNHSHHIGSHVTPRSTVEKIQEKLRSLGYFAKDLDNGDKCNGDCQLKLRKREIEIINRLKSTLDEYIQKKADFTSEIATEPLNTTISKTVFREVLLSFIQNTLLTDNIGANEGVTYEKLNGIAQNRLRIHFLLDNREIQVAFKNAMECLCKALPKVTNLNFPYTGSCPCHKTMELEADENNQDVAIAWPGPLGEFAFYCFLENLIRNAIKHNSAKFENPNCQLNVYVSVNNLNHGKDQYDFYEIEVWEDVSNPNELKSVTIDGKKEKFFLWKYMDTLAVESIVEDDGSLRRGAWGIAEMKIMATLMRGSADFTSMESSLTVECCEKQDKGNGKKEKRLVYKFYAMQSKEAVVISQKDSKAEESLKKHGIWWFKSFEKFKEQTGLSASIATFNIAILDKDAAGNRASFLHLLPNRILIPAPNEGELFGAQKAETDLICSATACNGSTEEVNGLIAQIWKEWINGFLALPTNSSYDKLTLFFGQSCDENPTAGWITKIDQVNSSKDNLKLSVIVKTGTAKSEKPDSYSSPRHQFFYDRHFDGYTVLNNSHLDFHAVFDKASSDFVPIFSSSPSNMMLWQLAESAYLKILIMDERVAQVAHNRILSGERGNPEALYGVNKRLVVGKFSNVFIATHLKINEDDMSLHPDAKEHYPKICVDVETVSNADTRINCKKIHYSNTSGQEEIKPQALIIHQGVLERFFYDKISKKSNETYKETLKALLEDLRRFIPYIFVVSGRGIPPNLPDDVKFMPFSLVEDYLMKDSIAKFCLTRVLMSFVRRGGNHVQQ